MCEQALISEPVSALTPASQVMNRPHSELLARQFGATWHIIAPAIALAGSSYPAVLALGLSVFTIAELLNLPFTAGLGLARNLGESFTIIFLGGTVGVVIGLIWASIVCVAILPLVYLFVWSLQLRGSITRLGACTGGLVGFVAVMPFILGEYSSTRSTLGQLVFLLFVGPGLTTILGQLGGASGGRRNRWYERAVASAAISNGHLSPDQAAISHNRHGSPFHVRFQFGLRHLLVVGVWFSLLLTAIRLSGLEYQLVLPLVIGWLVYQTATLWVGGLLARWFGRWRASRQTRST